MHRGTTATRERALTVGEVASLAGVSVRTLHHYDAIGLLSPAARSDAGYRLYGEDDLARLHQILAYRELGFELDAIAQLLTEPADEVEHDRTLILAKVRNGPGARQRLAFAMDRDAPVFRELGLIVPKKTAGRGAADS